MYLETEPTADLMQRTAREWSQIAGEPVSVEYIGGYLYAFGTEFGMLRLAHKFRSFNVKFSENRQVWRFCNERRADVEPQYGKAVA